MTSVSLSVAGSAGSAASGAAFAASGWSAVVLTGAAFSGLALVVWAIGESAGRRG